MVMKDQFRPSADAVREQFERDKQRWETEKAEFLKAEGRFTGRPLEETSKRLVEYLSRPGKALWPKATQNDLEVSQIWLIQSYFKDHKNIKVRESVSWGFVMEISRPRGEWVMATSGIAGGVARIDLEVFDPGAAITLPVVNEQLEQVDRVRVKLEGPNRTPLLNEDENSPYDYFYFSGAVPLLEDEDVGYEAGEFQVSLFSLVPLNHHTELADLLQDPLGFTKRDEGFFSRRTRDLENYMNREKSSLQWRWQTANDVLAELVAVE